MLPTPPARRPLPYIGGEAAAQPGRSEKRPLLLVWLRFPPPWGCLHSRPRRVSR